MKNYEYTVAIDLDGVSADFAGRIQQITGMVCESVPRGKLWASVEKYNREVAPFFESLDKMADADELWSFIDAHFGHYYVLTATGWTPRDGADQKTRWVAKTYGAHVPVKVVTSGSLKAQFATPKSILIDDTRKAIDPWIAAGGIGVFHTSAADSIKQLQEILRQTQV
jgi:hypothetical protein